MDYEHLPESIRSVCSQQLWDVIRDNVSTWDDVRDWHAICTDNTWVGLYPEGDTRICQAASVMMPKYPWDHNTWLKWVQSIQDHIDGVSRKEIFVTLRQALTGQTKGPKMNVLLPLVDPRCVKARLIQTSAMVPRSIQDI